MVSRGTQTNYMCSILVLSPKPVSLSLLPQNEVPDPEPECDQLSLSAARSLWSDRMALAGLNELAIEVQDYIPFS